MSTIVPAMNEEGNIDEFCRQFDKMRSSAQFRTELIFIDDGSTDKTLDLIKSNASKYDYIKFASHQRNCGLTAALQSGFEIAQGEIYVFYPADLQYKPEDIPKLIEPIKKGVDLCVGWKQGNYPLQKRIVSRIYNYLSRKIFGLKVHDLNSNYAFRKEVVEHIFLRKDWHRYLVVLAANEGYRIEEVKIPIYEREWGISKYGSLIRIPIGVLDMVAVKFQLTFLKKPLLFFGFIGSVCFVLGFLVGIWAVYLKYWHGETQLPLLYLVILLTGLGFGLFLMGFITEGLTAINEEVSELRRKFTKMSQSEPKEKD